MEDPNLTSTNSQNSNVFTSSKDNCFEVYKYFLLLWLKAKDFTVLLYSNLAQVCLRGLLAVLSLFLRFSNNVESAGRPEHLLGPNFQVLLVFDQEHVAFLVHPEEVECAGLIPLALVVSGWFLLAHL